MGDRAIVLAAVVDWKVVAERAALVLAWLVEQGVVEALPTDSGSLQLAHRPGPRALDAVVSQKPGVYDFRALRTNGLELRYRLRPELEIESDEMPSFRCASCKAEIDGDEVLAQVEKLSDPFQRVPEIACPPCGARRAVYELEVEGGAFGNLVLRFMNWWPLKESVLGQLEELCGARLTVLYEKH